MTSTSPSTQDSRSTATRRLLACLAGTAIAFAISPVLEAQAIEWCVTNPGERYFEGASDGDIVSQPATDNLVGAFLVGLEGPATHSHDLSIDHNAGYKWDHQIADLEAVGNYPQSCNHPIYTTFLSKTPHGYLNDDSFEAARDGYVLNNPPTQCPDIFNTYGYWYGTAALMARHTTGVSRNTCSGLLKHRCGASAAPHSLHLSSYQVKNQIYLPLEQAVWQMCMDQDNDWSVFHDIFCSSESSMCHRAGWQVANRVALDVEHNGSLAHVWSNYFRGTVPHTTPYDIVETYGISHATQNKGQPAEYGVCTQTNPGGTCQFFCS